MGACDVSDLEEELQVGQVWHFFCEDVLGCDDYYLLLKPLSGLALPGMWEVFDLLNCEVTYVCPLAAGQWFLM